MNVCVMDSPELKELYNSVKDTGESYESIKNLVNVWQLRKFNRNKNFDFTELPTKQDIENLLKERDVPNIDSVFVQEYSQEMKDILAKAPRDSQGRLLAPNGKPSNLNEWQYAQVRTKAFKKWFGDWEKYAPKSDFSKVEEQLVLVFERIPELSKIGSIREYAAYLADKFPNSVDRSVYWHGTNEDFSEGFKSAKKGKGSGAPETQSRNDFYLAKQAWTVLQYVNGVNRNSVDKNGFAHWNKLWWELKEIMSNGRRENNNWKDMVIGEETIRQGIPNKKGVFNRDKGGSNGKWLSERKADYGYENKSDKEFFEDILGIQWGKDTFNTWTKRNAEVFKSLEKTQKGIYPAIINTQNPIREKGQNTYYEEQRGLFTQAERESNDAILGEQTDNEFGSDVAVVLNASEKNVHFLGTKEDVERFKKWLEENRASKVIDENGEPLVVYHGTTQDFTTFSKDKLGSFTHAASAKLAFFATSNENLAKDIYAELEDNEHFYKRMLAVDPNFSREDLGIVPEDDPKDEIYSEFINNYDNLKYEYKDVIEEANKLITYKSSTKEITISKAFEWVEDKDISDYEKEGFVISDKQLADYKEGKEITISKPIKVSDGGTLEERIAKLNTPRSKEYLKELKELENIRDKELLELEEKLKHVYNSKVKALFLNIRNPKIDSDNGHKYRAESYLKRIQKAINNNNDGGIIKDTRDPYLANIYYFFEPNQVKSATDNIGTFSTEDNRIDRFEDTILNENNKLTEEQKQFILNALPNLDTFIEDAYKSFTREKHQSNPYYQLFSQIIDILKINNIPVSIVKDFNIDSIAQIRRTSFKEAVIEINPKMLFDYLTQFDRKYMSSKITKVILHELVHSITADVVASHPSWSEFKGFDEAQSKFNAEIDRLYNITVREIGSEEWYGLENKAEFIAEALSNKAFQKRLSELKYDKEQTIFDRIVNSIRDLFYRLFNRQGIDISNSVFDDILKVSQEYLDYAKLGINKNINTYGWGNTINRFKQIKSTNIEEDISSERTIVYTPIGKPQQTYTIKKSDDGNYQIINKEGKEVFKEDSKDRRRIFANLAVQEKRAVVVEHKGNKYVVNGRDEIISVATGDLMKWGDENGNRKAILEAAKIKFDKLKVQQKTQWAVTSDNNYEVSSAGDSRFSAFNAKLKPGTKILGVTVPEEKSTFIAGKSTTTNSIEYVYQTLIKKSSKGVPPPKNSMLYNESLKTKEEKEDYSYNVGYLPLWQEWASQNPELIEDLRAKSAGKVLTDKFANTRVSQARALADILNSNNTQQSQPQQTPIPENLKETPETVAQNINKEEQSSYVKRNVKAEIISQLEEELKDFGTFERRQDRINFILRFIRNQKKAYFKEHQQILQNKINDPSTTERDRKNYQKLLNNLDADEIFANNIDTIINRAKQALSPESVSRTLSRKLLEKGYPDFNTLTEEQQEQKITEDFNYRTQEFAKIQKHWNSLMEDVKSTLRVVDGYVIDFVKSKEDDNKDNQSEGEGTVKDNWMYEARKIDQRESLSKKVKTIINNIPILDRNGKQEIDDLGYPRFMNAEEVTSTLFYELSNARSCEHFWQKLNNLPNKKPWSKIIVDTINKEGNYEIKSQFYQNFRKESIPYWSQIWTKKGKITTKKINRGGKNNQLLEDWKDNIESGTILTPNSIYGENGKPNVEKAAENLKTLGKLVIEFKSKGNKLGNTNNLNTLLDLINSVGIEITTDELTRSIQNYPQKTEKIFNSLHTIFSKVSDNKTILSTTINNVVVYDNIVEKLDTQYNLLATLIDFDVKSIELQSFRELGDTYQSVSAPSYLGTLISNLTNTENEEEFKQFFEREFGQYTQFKDKETGRIKNEWLSILYNKPEERKNLERKVVLHSNRKEFNKQTPQEYLLGMLVEFIQPDINYAYYALPLLSDADSEEFIKFVRYTDGSVKNERGESISYRSIINEKLAQAIKDEYDRILMVNRRLKSNAETITTFDSRGTKFTYFPELNDITVNADGVINGEGENKLFKDALDYLTNTKQDLLPFISKVMGQIMDANSKEFISDAFNIANVELISEKLNMTKDSVPKLLDNFFYNYALANINMIQLLTTDLAYYKNTIDFFKRFKEVYASTLKLDTTAKFVGENGDEVKGSKTQSVMILKDNIIKSPSYDSIKSILEGRVQAGAITTRQMNDLLEAYSKVNVADAQGYRTLKSYRKLMVMAGRWNKKLERSYQRLKNGTFDFDDFNSIFNTIKPFCYSQRPVASQVVYTNESTNETVEYGNLKVPIQIKDSEVVLLAMYSTLVSPLNKSEKLVGLNKFMDDNDIDIVVFESGVKAGGQGIIDINNVENTYEALKNTVLTNGEKNPFYIHNISTEDLGIQVETPDHLVDVEQLIGSQIKKLIQGDIDVNNIGVTFRLNEGVKDREKTMNKQEMLSHINKLLSSNIIDSFEDLREEFSSLDKVAETLQKELKGNSRYTKDLIVACSLVETTDQIGNVIKEFALPLNDATQFSRIENLLTSLFKNQVIKQKIRGGSPIQFSCYGVSDDLHIEMTGEGTERRIKWVDCYMPAYTKEFFKYYMTTDENGNQFVDINKVPEELKRLVGYRVPTEARYSMLPLRIKGFLPSSEGSKIMVPADITTIAGSDFDVDKLYVLLPTFYTKHTKNGDVLNYVKYDYSKTEQENSKDARNNELISCIFSVLTNEDSADKLLTPGGFDIAKQASYICNIFSAGKKTVEKLFGRKINTEEDAVNLYYELFTYSNKKLGSYNEILNAGKGVTNPITQVKIHDQNATGGALIGVYANHNVAHSMFQNIGNQLEGFAENTKPQLAKTVVFNDKEYKGLTNVKNYEGHLITTNIANFLAASVDNAKDPVLKALMQNNTTANTACLMLRLGIEPITVGLFLNQPIIKEILSLVENGTEIKEAIKVTEEKYKQFAETPSNRNYYKMFDSDLAFNLLFAEQGKNNPKFNNYQFWVLKKFKYLYKAGDYLGRYTNLNKADTQNGAAGPSIAEVINKLTKIYRFNKSINNVKERLVKGKPVSTPVFFLPEIGSKENFIGDATEYSILHIPELLEDYLPYFSDYVSYLINTLADVKNTDNESDVNEISDNSVANVIKELTLFSYSRFVKKPLNYYLNDYLNKFIDLKNKYPELSDNLFFKRLKLTQPLLKKGVQLRLLQFSNAGSLSKLQKEQISKSWEMLNRSDNEEIRTFMNELFDYFFYVGGFNFNAINPSYLTPISVKLENDNYVNSLKNIGTLSEYELILFKEQFILHHLDEFAVDVSRIIPSITLTDKQDKEFKFDINKAPEVFKTIETLPNYIKIIADNKVIYYEYNRDSDIYVHIKPLGLTGKVFEYNIFDNTNKGNLGDIKQNLNLEGLYKDTEEVPKEEASMPNKSDSTELRQQYDANIAAANGSSLEEFGFGTEFVDESKSKKPTNKLDSYNIDTEIKDINDMPICGSM